jgi:hypothetical protein
MFSQILSYFEEDDNSSLFLISTSVACAKCELVTRLIFPFKIIFLGDLIELPMAKITQNSSSVGSLGLNLCLWISNSPSWNQNIN